MARNSPIAVLGAGSWGTALAMVLARNNSPVRLWGRDAAHLAALELHRENRRYLPDVAFTESIHIEPDLRSCLDGVTDVLVVVPSHAFADVLRDIAAAGQQLPRIAWASKGLQTDIGGLLPEVAARILGKQASTAVLSGPTFAAEVARELPAGITLASADAHFAQDLSARLQQPSFRVYTSDDVVGVSVGGAVKNVLAIAAGIADGLRFGANAQAALVTRGLSEMSRLTVAAGGRVQTMMGLAGLGDLVLTCTDDQSRNRRMGLGIASGDTVEQVSAQIGQVVEGVRTAREVHELAADYGVDMPIANQVYRVLYEGLSARTAVKELLGRASGREEDDLLNPSYQL